MGAPSISVFAATRILRITGAPAVAAARPVITSLAIVFWTFGTALIPLLAMLTALTTVTTLRRLLSGRWPRYRPEAWAVIFPLGMYAMASLELGAAAGVPLIAGIGAVAVSLAAAAWALVAITMAAAPFRRTRPARPTISCYDKCGRTEPGSPSVQAGNQARHPGTQRASRGPARAGRLTARDPADPE